MLITTSFTLPPPHSSMAGRLLHHLFLPGKKNLTDEACRARLLLKFPCIHYSLPPPPPPPPHARAGSTLSPTLIILIAVLCCCILLASYYFIIIKLCSRWSRSRATADAAEVDVITDHDMTADQSDRESVNSAVNFIWYVHTVGLDESVITSITVCKYKKGEGLVDATDCSVCLAEFREDEDLRLLPKCGHAFHVPCIDKWLASHVNCPLCRAAVVVPTTNPAPSEQHHVTVDMESSTAPTHVGLAAADGQSSLESAEDLEAAMSRSVPCSSDQGCYRMRVVSDLAGSLNRVSEEDGVQYVQRSVSMNSSVLRRSDSILGCECWEDQRWMKVMSSSIKRGRTRCRRIAMKRCYSNGARFFPAKNMRSMNSSAIPV